MRDQNYATLSDYQPWPDHDPGWFLLEWDIALGRAERDRFEANALRNPDRVRVAPYLLYPSDGPPRQCHRWEGRPIAEGRPNAEQVGLGCIYLPKTVMDDFWQHPPPAFAQRGMFNDGVFSDWHRLRYGKGEFDVDWTVHPQHLHGD